MDFHHTNQNETKFSNSAYIHKNSINLIRCNSIKNENKTKKLSINNDSLFKGKEAINRTQTKKTNKAPVVKHNSANNKNIFNFVNALYSNEEHLNKNVVNSFKYSEESEHQDNIPSPAKTLHHETSIKGSCEKFRSSRLILNLSKEKHNSNLKAPLLKKNSCNTFSSFSLKRKSRKNNHSGFSKYSFFYKLKEKDKIPSKTPYLDTKFWNSSFHLQKYDFNENTGNRSPNKKISNKSLFYKFQSPKHLKKVVDKNNKSKEKKMKNNNNNLDKISSTNNKQNDIITLNNIEKEKEKETEKETVKESKKLSNDNNNNNNENKNCLQNKSEKKKSNNIIVNILHKPFFCCLKSN
jgi:hypothetical protein